MPFIIGKPTGVAVGNIKNVERALVADTNRDGIVQESEAAEALARLTGDQKSKTPLADFIEKAGGERHDVRMYAVREQPWYMSYGMYHKGDFNVPELGGRFGNVATQHRMRYISPEGNTGPVEQVSVIRFGINCDGFPLSFFNQDVESAALILGPEGFPRLDDSVVAEAVDIPLDFTYEAETWRQQPRSGGWYSLPETKFMVAEVAREDLAKIAGDSGGVEFFVQIKLKDGRTVYINKDGQPGSNFALNADEEFRGLGQP